MELYQGITLGIIQGLTEFLPVSSSGHLVLGQIFFGITQSQLTFDISVHVGTLLAVLVVYASDIRAILTSVAGFLAKALSLQPVRPLLAKDSHLQTAIFIVAASVPTAAIGLVLKQFEHILFTSQTLVGLMLILTGTVLWFSRNFYFSGNNENNSTDSNLTESRANQFTMKKAIAIGIVQGLAVIPGVSRSGSTIAAGMFMRIDRHQAARFSFLLSIPAIVGAEILGLKDVMDQGLVIDPVTLYATMASFITGLIALKILLRLVHAGRFHLFAPYCWFVGAVVLLSKIF
jgi:undecaprenyl-diphosphatase